MAHWTVGHGHDHAHDHVRMITQVVAQGVEPVALPEVRACTRFARLLENNKMRVSVRLLPV